MKVLLDEMLPSKLARRLIGHEVSTVADKGWQQITNGQLLSKAEAAGFEVLITKDANMPYQQSLTGRSIALLVLRPRTQDVDDLLAMTADILSALNHLAPGRLSVVAHNS